MVVSNSSSLLVCLCVSSPLTFVLVSDFCPLSLSPFVSVFSPRALRAPLSRGSPSNPSTRPLRPHLWAKTVLAPGAGFPPALRDRLHLFQIVRPLDVPGPNSATQINSGLGVPTSSAAPSRLAAQAQIPPSDRYRAGSGPYKLYVGPRRLYAPSRAMAPGNLSGQLHGGPCRRSTLTRGPTEGRSTVPQAGTRRRPPAAGLRWRASSDSSVAGRATTRARDTRRATRGNRGRWRTVSRTGRLVHRRRGFLRDRGPAAHSRID